MDSTENLGIELALARAGGDFNDKYRLMKSRLLNVEYEHWAAGFPEGNNHGRGHILRVLSHLDLLLGDSPLQHLDVYELFLAMMSVLYHDVGVLRQRKDHPDISKMLLEGDEHDAYIINKIDKEIIAAAVVSHSSSKDIAKECARFSAEEIIGKHRARPAVVAALVRLADELDEDYRRADPILQAKLNVPTSSDFFWRFCQRIRGVRPNLVAKRIDFNVAFEDDDTTLYGTLPDGATRHFIAFAAQKLAKINSERVVVNRFLPPALQYSGIHIDVKPLRQHATWKGPRTFVFNDNTSADMFLNSFPELLLEPAMATLQAILDRMKCGELEQADSELDRLRSAGSDLPPTAMLGVLYEKACVASLTAKTREAASQERQLALDRGVHFVCLWLEFGTAGAFKLAGRTANAEVERLVIDRDFATLLRERLSELPQQVREAHLRLQSGSGGGGSGCVPRGSLIRTPKGLRAVEDLRIGDDVISTRLSESPATITAQILRIGSSRSPRCLRVNGTWLITPHQPVHSERGWIAAQQLRLGDSVTDDRGRPVKLNELVVVDGYFEVFDLSTSDRAHNYSANGLLCHNKDLPPDPWRELGLGR